MGFVPYLHFSGNCAEAMTFYAKVFAAPPPSLMLYKDAPDGPPDWKDSTLVIHSELKLGAGSLMASDFPPGQGEKQAAVSIMHQAPDVAAAQMLFKAIGKGGDVIMPFGPSFFSTGFGMVRDRFGTHWMIDTAADT